MFDVISVDNMRRSDEFTIASFVSSEELMRRAAMGIFESLSRVKEIKQSSKIIIVVGSGNNGGDGFALAEILLKKKLGTISIHTVTDHFSADSVVFKDRVSELGVEVLPIDTNSLKDADIIVDCLLGTGFKGEVRGNYKDAIIAINNARSYGAYVVSADINSGLNGDTGEAVLSVKSDLLVTIGYYKKGIILGQINGLVNDIALAPIGIVLERHEDYLLTQDEWESFAFPEDEYCFTKDNIRYFRLRKNNG